MLSVKSVTCLTLQQTVFNRPSEASYQDNKIRRNKSKLWVSLPFSSNQSLRVWWSKAFLSGWWEIWGTFKQSELLSTGDRNIFIYISCIAIWRCSTESNWVWHLFFFKDTSKGLSHCASLSILNMVSSWCSVNFYSLWCNDFTLSGTDRRDETLFSQPPFSFEIISFWNNFTLIPRGPAIWLLSLQVVDRTEQQA